MKPSEALHRHRETIRRIVESHRSGNPRVFGSAQRGEDTEQSDLDILVDLMPQTSLFDIGAIQMELQELLGVSVDVLTLTALPERFRAAVIAQAEPI